MADGRVTHFAAWIIETYLRKRVSRAAAALAYFLMLSVFPMLICLYEMLGSMFPALEDIVLLVDGILPEGMQETILDYIGYISRNNSDAMLWGAVIAMVTSSAAAFRTMHTMIGEIMGRLRFKGLFSLVFSFAFSLLFPMGVYFAVIVMITGNWFIRAAGKYITFINIAESWGWLRFLVLFCLLMLIIYALYRLTLPRGSRVSIVPGSVFSSATLVGISMVFSYFIGMSARYPLVYGSLASVIILLLWLYVCGNVLFIGAIINAAAPGFFNPRPQ